MKITIFLSILFLTSPSFAADPEIRNGDFEKGKQFWRGDGKVVILPEGGKVLELKADDKYNDEVTQDLDLDKVEKAEITLRVRGIQYKGDGLRISLQLRGGGTQFYRGMVTDAWTDIRWNYERKTPVEKFVFGLSPFPGTGAIQVDDVKIKVISKSGK